jgi:uncharacterized damage-inducible protein DinB
MRRLQTLTLAAVFAGGAPSIAYAQAQAPAPRTITLAAQIVRSYQNVQRNLLEAAEKMPDASYSFKATPEVRPFGQLIAHVALTQFANCAALKGDAAAPHKDEEDATRTKTELVALLKESAAYCDPVVTPLKDEDLTALAKVGQNQIAKGVLAAGLLTHGNEMYGTIAVYLRLKGLVPPTTERENAARSSKSSQ